MSTTEHDDDRTILDSVGPEIEDCEELSEEEEEIRRLAAMGKMPARAELEAMISRLRSAKIQIEDDSGADQHYRHLIEQVTPTRAQLDRLIDRPSSSEINYDEEDDELPC